MRRAGFAASLLAIVAAAGAPTLAGSAAAATTLLPVSHVILILEENHSQSEITSTSMPYLVGLGNTYAHTTHYSYSGCGPSLPNYLALTSGGTQGKCGTDCGTSTSGCTVGAANIFQQATTAGKGWRELAQSEGVPCNHSNNGAYVVHHAPPPFYTDISATVCKASDLPLVTTAFPDVTQAYAFVTPDNAHNAHSASLSAADAYLKAIIPQIQARADYISGATLIEVTFDESGTVYTAFIRPGLSHKVLTLPYTHYSTLRLDEELLGFPLLGAAKTAPDLRTALGL